MARHKKSSPIHIARHGSSLQIRNHESAYLEASVSGWLPAFGNHPLAMLPGSSFTNRYFSQIAFLHVVV